MLKSEDTRFEKCKFWLLNKRYRARLGINVRLIKRVTYIGILLSSACFVDIVTRICVVEPIE